MSHRESSCIIHLVLRQEDAKEEDESYITRQDQLNMKPERGNRGRGRGGKGRGRGRGSTKETKHKMEKMSDEKWDWWNQAWIDEWGHPDEEWFSDGYGDSSYYWDRYAWHEGAESLEQLETETKKGKGKQPEEKEPVEKKKVKKTGDAGDAKSKGEKPADNAKTKASENKGPSKKKAKTNAMPSAGSTNKKRKPACEKAADQSSEPSKKRRPRPRQPWKK